VKDNSIILDGCSPDLVMDLSGWELESFNYPLDPSPRGVIGSIECVKSPESELSGVGKLHSGFPSKDGIIESEVISTSEDKVSAIKNTIIKRKPV